MQLSKLEEDDMEHMVVELIHDYLGAAEGGIQEMKCAFGFANLLHARRENLIPVEGTVEGKVSFKFSFHGVGCAITSEQYAVDFDFDENGSCAGFDAWRLWQFAKSHGGHYCTMKNQEIIAHNLQELENAGRIRKTGRLPNPEMFRLTVM